MSNIHMLQLNKHFMQNSFRETPPVPMDVTPITLTVLPMERSASAEVVITSGEFVEVLVLVSGEKWVRLPERRCAWRRDLMAASLRESARLYSLESFLIYIRDCGFQVQP
jgi:hypothetical protein